MKNTKRKPAFKIERTLVAMLYHGSINQQQAEAPELRVRHLNTEVSALVNEYNLPVSRQRRPATGYAGEPLTLTSYWVAEPYRGKAKELVNGWRIKRGAVPLPDHHPLFNDRGQLRDPIERYFR